MKPEETRVVTMREGNDVDGEERARFYSWPEQNLVWEYY